MSGSIIEELRRVSLRHSGRPHSTLLSDLIAGGEIIHFIRNQYPNLEQTGQVQFIPELRGISAQYFPNFIKSDLLHPDDYERHKTNIVGDEHEIKVQDLLASLRNSELLSDHSLVVMHNVGKRTIRFHRLKQKWTNEFDLIMFDPTFGVFIGEIKSRQYENLRKKDGDVTKQERRYRLLSEVREFYGKKLPIHTLLICQSYNNEESQIVEEAFKNIQDHDYRIVINLNVEEDFSNIWKLILCYLTSVFMLHPPTGNVTEFAAVLYAILFLEEHPPSIINCKFFAHAFQKTRTKPQIKWSREQKEILDCYHEKCLMNEGSSGKMRLCISGCYGSGKTMLLIKFAETFTDKFHGSQVLFLVHASINILLLDTLRNTLRNCPLIKCALSAEFVAIYSALESKDTLHFLESCKQYPLILIDEFLLSSDDKKLDVSNIKDSHLALVTSDINTKNRLPAEFKVFNLSGSLRSTKDITEYTRKVQAKEQLRYPGCISVNTGHNVSYRHVITNNFASGEICVEQCITCINELFKHDSNQCVMVIGLVHRWFLYTLSMRLKDENISHQFKLHSGSLQSSSDNTDNSKVTLCDPDEALGSERTTVIVVCGHEGYSGAGALSLSRATTQAFVYEIDVEYNEDIPINLVPALSTYIAQDIRIPCYTKVGKKNQKAFIEYVNYLVKNGITGQNKVYPDEEKKILVTYAYDDESMISKIKESLPVELQHVIVFESYNSASYLSLDFSKEFILVLYCYCGGLYYSVIVSTILPLKQIELTTE